MRCVLVLVLVLVVGLGGCAQPEVPPGEFDPELGVGPVVTEDEPAPLATPTPVSATAPDSPPGSTPSPIAESEDPVAPQPAPEDSSPAAVPSPAPPASSPAPEPAEDAEPVVLLAVGDRGGDHGLQGPDWADLTSVELVEFGNDLRVTLRFADQVPASPPEGQVPLINVDIGEGDRSYQLHVGSDGTGEGWAAYLHTPQGLVQYPGTFELAGSAIVLQIPFNAVGSPTRAPVRALVEWSEDRALLNASSEDRLDGEPHTFDRNP